METEKSDDITDRVQASLRHWHGRIAAHHSDGDSTLKSEDDFARLEDAHALGSVLEPANELANPLLEAACGFDDEGYELGALTLGEVTVLEQLVSDTAARGLTTGLSGVWQAGLAEWVDDNDVE